MFSTLSSAIVSTPLCSVDDSIISQRTDKQGFSVTEMSTGLLTKSIKPYRNSPNKSDIAGICASGHKIMSYSTGGVFFFFDAEKASGICSAVTKVKNHHELLDACASRTRDSMFFFVASNTSSIGCIFLSAVSATLSPYIRLDSLGERHREYISGITCHPTNSYLFVRYAKGSVQVWNYKNVRKNLVSKSGDDNADENLPNEDDGDDEDEENRSSSRKSSKYAFSPSGLLKPPGPEREAASLVATDSAGSLSAVVWTGADSALPDVVSVYDARFHSSADMNVQALGTHNLANDIGVRITGVAFHPLEPILYISCSQGESNAHPPSSGRGAVVALSLLEPSMRVISHHTLDFVPSSLTFRPNGTGVILTTYDVQGAGDARRGGTSSDGTRPVRVVSMDISLVAARAASWISPTVSTVSVPPETYIDGDAILHHKVTGPAAIQGPWSVALVLQSELETFTPGTRSGESKFRRPQSTFFSLYRVKLNTSSQESAGAVFVGSLPSLVSKPAEGDQPWVLIAEEDHLRTSGFLAPLQLKANHIVPGGIGENGSWDAILTGNSYYGAKQSFGNMLRSVPVVGFVRYVPPSADTLPTDSRVQSVFGNYKDAVFYTPTRDPASPQTPPPTRPCEILALHCDGLVLEILPQAGDPQTPRVTTSLLVKMESIFAPHRGAANVLVMCSDPEPPEDVQVIYMTEPGHLTVDPVKSQQMSLLSGERVIDCQWQPMTTTSFPDSTPEKARHQCWMDSTGLMLGVLTTHRVILLTSSFQVINTYWNNGKGTSKGPLVLPDRAISLSWAGRSLLFMLESGAVDYLVPCLNGTLLASRAFHEESLARSMGVRVGYDTTRGRLCTLAKRQTMTGASRIIACLPDRLLFASVTQVSGMPYVSLMVRPCLPVEPLVMGLIQPPLPPPPKKKPVKLALSADPFAAPPPAADDAVLAAARGPMLPEMSPEELRKLKFSLLETMVTMYVPAKAQPGATSEGGALPMTQSTRRLCIALADAGFSDIVLAYAGVCTNQQEGAGADFLRTKWISPGVKFTLGVRAGRFAEACNDLLASRPELQELFIDTESYGGKLPHRESAFSRQYVAAAHTLAAVGQYDMARKLADIAGDEVLLSALLKSEKSGNRLSDLKSLHSALSVKSGRYYKILENFLSQEELDKDEESALKDWDIPVRGIGGADRRTTLLSLTSPLPNHPHNVADALNLQTIDRNQRNHTGARGGGLGPLTKLGVLAMDTVEDWVGKSKPEVVSFSGGISSRAGGGNVEEEVGLPDGEERPDTWVDEIGTGKEWDKISGYWRFSDISRPGEEEFVSNGEPKARLNITDLSKFAVPAELFADSPGRLTLEPSTSAVDPGEDHEKVKGLNDVIFSRDPYPDTSIPVAGLRTVIGRGSQLDVGMYHQDPNRNNLTIELNIFRCEEAAGDRAPPSGHCLMKRCVGPPSSDASHFSNELWSLSVDGSGALKWKAGNTEVKTEANEVNMGPTAEIPVSVWSHIAVVIDSSGGNGVAAQVSLFVNGNRCNKELVSLPPHDMSTTTLYMGCNLSGWRMTEVRMWADSRQTIDLEGMRDNYLPLASKRKRMQFRIKGSKKLFGPAPASLAVGGVDPPAGASRKPQSSKPAESTPSKSGGLASPGGFPAPASGGLGSGLTPPGGAKRNRRASLAGPPSGGGLSPPGGGLRPPPARGLRPPAAGPKIEEEEEPEESGEAEEKTPQQAVFIEESDSGTTAPVAEAAEVKEKKIDAPIKTVPAAKLKPIGGLAAPPSASRKGRRSSLGSFDTAAVSRQLAIVRVDSKDVTSATEVDTKTFIEKDISVAGLTSSDVVRCIRRRPLSSGLPMVTPSHAQSFDQKDSVIVVDMPTNSSSDLVFNKFEISAESAIISPYKENRIIAFYKQKKLIIKNVDSEEILVEMPMSLPHVFWKYDGADSILLASALHIYSWDVSVAKVKSSRPAKLTDRIDIADSKRWMERKVLDMTTCRGWLMVTTCSRLNAEGTPATLDEAVSSCVVSLYHAASRRSVQYHGTCGCFLGDDQEDPRVAIFVSTGTSRNEMVYCVDLTKSGAVENSTLPVDTKDLAGVVAETGEEIYWSVALPVMQLHLGSLPSTTVPGSLLAFFREESGDRLVLISSVGSLFTLSAASGELLKSSSVSEDYIVSSDFHLSSSNQPSLYILTGVGGKIVRIPPSAILSSD